MSGEEWYQKARVQGFAFIAGGVVLILLSLLMGWSGFCQWWAIRKFQKYRFESFRNYPEGVVAATTLDPAAAAAGWYATDTRVALCAVDTTKTDESHFDRLSGLVPAGQRHYVSVGRNFLRVLHGLPTVDFNPREINGQLVSYMEQLNNTERAPLPPFPRISRPPDRNIYLASIERRLQRAWELGDKEELVAAMGQLPTLEPRHPAAKACNLFCMFRAEKPINRKVLRNVSNTVRNKTIRRRILRAAAHIFEDRSLQALDQLGSAARGDEVISVMRNLGYPMERIVNRTLGWRNPQMAADIFRECIRIGDIKNARRILDEYKHFGKRQIEELRGVFDEHVQNVKADVRLLQTGFNYVCFHVCTAEGKVPRVPIDIQIDDLPLNKDTPKIRLGSLVHVTVPGAGRFELKVSIKGRNIFLQEVRK